MWGDSVEFYEVPPESRSAISWDETSSETISELRQIIVQQSWWDAFCAHLSMEKTIDVSAASSMVYVL